MILVVSLSSSLIHVIMSCLVFVLSQILCWGGGNLLEVALIRTAGKHVRNYKGTRRENPYEVDKISREDTEVQNGTAFPRNNRWFGMTQL